MKILVTGFDPFGGEPTNPSWEAVRRLPDKVAGAEIIKVQIPTVFGKCSGGASATRSSSTTPTSSSASGQAGGRFAVMPGARGDQHRRRAHPRQRGLPADRRADPRRRAAGLLQLAADQGDGHGDEGGRRPCRGVEHRRHLRLQPRHVPGPLHDRPRVPRASRAASSTCRTPRSRCSTSPACPSLGLDDMTTALTAGLEAIVEYARQGRRAHVGGAIH